MFTYVNPLYSINDFNPLPVNYDSSLEYLLCHVGSCPCLFSPFIFDWILHLSLYLSFTKRDFHTSW